MSPQELCSTCPLLQGVVISPDLAAKEVEHIRARPEDQDDRNAILSMATGELVLHALELPRPERCAQLDELLPDKHIRHRRKSATNACPEVALAGIIGPQEYPENVD